MIATVTLFRRESRWWYMHSSEGSAPLFYEFSNCNYSKQEAKHEAERRWRGASVVFADEVADEN